MFAPSSKQIMIYSEEKFTIAPYQDKISPLVLMLLKEVRGLSEEDIARLFRYNCMTLKQAAYLLNVRSKGLSYYYNEVKTGGKVKASLLNAARLFHAGKYYRVMIVVDHKLFATIVKRLEKQVNRAKTTTKRRTTRA